MGCEGVHHSVMIMDWEAKLGIEGGDLFRPSLPLLMIIGVFPMIQIWALF